VLGDDGRSLAGNVAHDDTQLAGRHEVEGIGPDPAHGGHPEPRQLQERLAGPLDRSPGVHETDGIARPRDLLLGRGGPVGVEPHLPVAAEAFQMR